MSGIIGPRFLFGAVILLMARGAFAAGEDLIFIPHKLTGGVFFVGEKKEYRVVLRNRAGTEARIQSVETDCECMSVTARPDAVPAMGEAVLGLAYLSGREVDACVKVTVHYGVGKKIREARMEFSAEVLERKLRGSRNKVEASGLVGKSDGVIVDVRPADRFREVRIPGSLNLPLFAVKTQTFLRAGRVVLMGNGWDDGPLQAGAMAMEKAGFRDVSVMTGGIRAWEMAGGTLERARYLNLGLAPGSSVRFMERDSEWTIIRVAEEAANPMPSDAAGLARVDFTAKPGELAGKIGALTGKILLVATTEQEARSVLESLPPGLNAVVFSVEGGLPAVARAEQADAYPRGGAVVRVQGIKQIGAPGRGAAKKGCGSCQ